jgi:DNA-binding MarR family transcriptional regulator
MTSGRAAAAVVRVAATAGSFGSNVSTALVARLGDPGLIGTHTVLVLCALAVHGTLRPREVIETTGLTSGGATHHLDRLVEAGVIDRAHGRVADDRRAVTVSLTAHGSEVVEIIGEVVLAHASDFEKLLDAIDDALDDALDATAPARARAANADMVPPDLSPTARAAEIALIVARIGVLIGDSMRGSVESGALVTNESGQVLAELAMGDRRPRDLERVTGLSSGGVSKLIARLEHAGLVVTAKGTLAADRRATLVSLTPRGRRVLISIARSLVVHADAMGALVGRARVLLAA